MGRMRGSVGDVLLTGDSLGSEQRPDALNVKRRPALKFQRSHRNSGNAEENLMPIHTAESTAKVGSAVLIVAATAGANTESSTVNLTVN
jgi:hypothetical protein